MTSTLTIAASPPSSPRIGDFSWGAEISYYYQRKRPLFNWPSALQRDVDLHDDVLGIGAQAIVFHGVWRTTNVDVAVKVIFKAALPKGHEIPVEIQMLASLQHSRLIQYFAHYEDAQFWYLVLELAGPNAGWSNGQFDVDSGLHRSESCSSTIISSTDSGTSISDESSDACLDLICDYLSYCHRPGEQLPMLPLKKSSRDLFEFLEQNGPLSEDQYVLYAPAGQRKQIFTIFLTNRSRTVFLQLLDVVEYLHSKGICHRDIKDENIIISEDLSIKLIDLGSAEYLERPQHGTFGTAAYMSPEAVRSASHLCNARFSATTEPCHFCYDGAAADSWALGVVLYVMVNGSAPFNSAWETLWQLPKPYCTKVSEPLKLVLSRLLLRDPKKRWSISDVRQSAWISGSVK